MEPLVVPLKINNTKKSANLGDPKFFSFWSIVIGWISTCSWINFSTQQTSSLTKGGEAIWHIGELDGLGRPHVKYPNQETLILPSILLSKVSKMDFQNKDVLTNVAFIFENDSIVSWGWSIFLYKVKVWKSTARRAGASGQACLPKYRAARRKVAREAEILRQDDLATAQCHKKLHDLTIGSWWLIKRLMILHPPFRIWWFFHTSKKFSSEHSPKNKKPYGMTIPAARFKGFTMTSQEAANGGKHRHAAVLQLGFAATTEGLQVTVLSHPVNVTDRQQKNDPAETPGHC